METVTPVALEKPQQHVILFYRYHPLASDPTLIELYRSALENLCQQLDLKGRILVGASETEGINGTLAGRRDCLRAFTWALLGDHSALSSLPDEATEMRQAVETFWTASRDFFEKIGKEELRMQSAEDFKWSDVNSRNDDKTKNENDAPFPDLRIVVRKELIGSSGGMAGISIEETAKGYLTPAEWHDRLTKVNENTSNTVVIDCRNTKEFEIGHFHAAMDPQTTTFSQFPVWVQRNKALLANKEVLMYCTG